MALLHSNTRANAHEHTKTHTNAAHTQEGTKISARTHLLEAAAIGGETFVEGNGVAAGVLPVGDARRDLPLLLLLRRYFPEKMMKND